MLLGEALRAHDLPVAVAERIDEAPREEAVRRRPRARSPRRAGCRASARAAARRRATRRSRSRAGRRARDAARPLAARDRRRASRRNDETSRRSARPSPSRTCPRAAARPCAATTGASMTPSVYCATQYMTRSEVAPRRLADRVLVAHVQRSRLPADERAVHVEERGAHALLSRPDSPCREAR